MTRKMHGVCYWINGEVMCCRKKLIDFNKGMLFLGQRKQRKNVWLPDSLIYG
jgi:hypothetical protein